MKTKCVAAIVLLLCAVNTSVYCGLGQRTEWTVVAPETAAQLYGGACGYDVSLATHPYCGKVDPDMSGCGGVQVNYTVGMVLKPSTEAPCGDFNCRMYVVSFDVCSGS
jgi:hypothetical protein